MYVCIHTYICRLFGYTCVYVEMVEQALFAVVLHDKPSQYGEGKVCMYACMYVCMYVCRVFMYTCVCRDG